MSARESPELFEHPKYGWFKYRPRLLQCCLTSRWILAACCFLVLSESFIVIGLSGVTITSLEKRFYLRSFQVGVILTCYEVSAILLTLVVSYYGHVHKAKWLGSGAIALGIGCLLFAAPQWLSGTYSPIVAQTNGLCQEISYNNQTTAADELCKNSEWYYICIFVLGQLLIGAGASPIYNLCTAYIDENVSRKNSGIYLAVFYAVSATGPALGFLLGGYFLTIYVDIEQVCFPCSICLENKRIRQLMLSVVNEGTDYMNWQGTLGVECLVGEGGGVNPYLTATVVSIMNITASDSTNL